MAKIVISTIASIFICLLVYSSRASEQRLVFGPNDNPKTSWLDLKTPTRKNGLPNLRMYTNDEVGVLTENQIKQLDDLSFKLNKATGVEIATLIAKDFGGRSSIEDFTTDVFNENGIGIKGIDTGILIAIVPSQSKSRIETGYGIEAEIPDGKAGELLRKSKEVVGETQDKYFKRLEYLIIEITTYLQSKAEWSKNHPLDRTRYLG